jgi:hypothetical protein
MPTIFKPEEYAKKMYGFGGSSGNAPIFYLFSLTLTFKDNTIKHFNKIENKCYCNIIDTEDLVNFNNIKSFNLKIITLPNKEIKLELLKDFNSSMNCYKIYDKKIRIEFTKNHMNYTFCSCRFINNNIKKVLSFSPC